MERVEADWVMRVAAGHRWLAKQADEGPSSADGVLHFGMAVLAYAFIEERSLFDLSTLLDPAVVSRLRDEHERLSEDLKLLESLSDSPEDGPDRAALARSLQERLRDHVRREERLVYEPIRRTRSASSSPLDPPTAH